MKRARRLLERTISVRGDVYQITCEDGRLFETPGEDVGIHEIIRWLVQLPFGFKVYRLYRQDSEVCYCTVCKGGSPRYPFASKRDIIVGPYYVAENERGKGLAAELLVVVLDELECNYENAWAFINHQNIASQKTAQKAGMVYVFDARYTSLTRRLKQVEGKGHMMMFNRYKGSGI